jgi:alpha-tubulin suppressor-like RCC1 family protein
MGQLGVNATDTEKSNVPILVYSSDFEGKIENIFSGPVSNFAIDSIGNVYGWGSTEYFIMGQGYEQSIFYKPFKLNHKNFLYSEEYIINIEVGFYASIFLTNQGRVFGMGYNGRYEYNDFGRVFGDKYPEDLISPTLLDYFNNVDEINYVDGALFLNSGDLTYVVGLKQLFFGNDDSNTYYETKIKLLSDGITNYSFIFIGGGIENSFSIAIDFHGSLYIWGRSNTNPTLIINQ